MTYKFTFIFFLFAIFSVAFAEDDLRTLLDEDSDYQGKVYKEIRIDESGILLIDTAGQETEIDPDGYGEMGSERKDRYDEAQEKYEDQRIKGKIYNQINLIGESLILEEDEYVKGAVVIVGGNATIRGHVAGSITVLTGRVRVTSTGVVEGDINAREVIEELGSEIQGSITESNYTGEFSSSFGDSETTTTLVVFLLIQFVAALGAVVLFQKPVAKIKRVYQENIFKSFFVGFVLICLLPLVFALLCITIIGIPVAGLILPLAIVAASILGAGAFCLRIADLVRSKTDKTESLFFKVLIGYIVLQSPLMASIFGSVVGSELIFILFGVTSIIINSIVLCLSVGAVFFTRFGTRYYQRENKKIINVQVNT